MKSYSVETFGCRANAADGDGIAAELRALGLREAENRREAEVVVVQTCAVTAEAERGARALIRRVGRENPAARIVVTGCYAQRAPGELAELAGVDAVVGNSHRGMAARVAAGLTGSVGFIPIEKIQTVERHGIELFLQSADKESTSKQKEPGEGNKAQVWHEPFGSCAEGPAALPALAPDRRTRPVLRVQDGCGNRCSFCVIPETRGPSRSVGLLEAVEAADRFAEEGGAELVLSGINLGRWGRELQPQRTLPELVRALLEETGLPRLRVSSVEPMDWSPELLRLFERYGTGTHPRLAPHAHLPLQSGADAVLRVMHRRYRPWHYTAKLEELRARLPEAALGADVMVGFPGETDVLFEESCRLIEALPLTYLHVFPFSPRPGTRAEHLPGSVQPEVKRKRAEQLRALDAQKRQDFAERFLGKELSAVTLRDGTALTANFLSVRLKNGGSFKTGLTDGPSAQDDALGRGENFSNYQAHRRLRNTADRLVIVHLASIEAAEDGAAAIVGELRGCH